jgi:hypothetical protein
MNEANRLARVLGKTCCTGVPIFDLIGEIAEAGGLELVRAEIDGDHQGLWSVARAATWRWCAIRRTRWRWP